MRTNVRKKSIKERWRNRRKRMGKRLLPLFAPLILSPSASIGAGKYVSINHKLKPNVTALSVMRFEQVSFDLYTQMNLSASDLNYDVFNNALMGYYGMYNEGRLSDKGILTIVDFTKPSSEKRLWVLDLNNRQVLSNTYVAHGRGSGEVMAQAFSNEHKSFMSSVGFYVTDEVYYGKHGKSLRLDGLDEAHNSNARDRAVVMHGAEYATEDFMNKYGRLGRSLGCPAVPLGEHESIIDAVKGKTALYIHSGDLTYTSHYLDNANAVAGYMASTQPTQLPPAEFSI
ncbi:murein L,D-transpeptidase catalytic domain family protein [Pontibacter sp. FD36]|uniref:murein L,D-transpeptidase catalytic domain family protein n=1 Tax=Pontibacter sp. FD36 TaxID=2789860 RepID=UPI00351C9EC2